MSLIHHLSVSLEQYRDKKRLSIADLSREIGISPITYSKLIKGNEKASNVTLRKIEAFLELKQTK